MNQKIRPEIVLVRGLPGSGKSTFAKSMAGYAHFEADMYFMVDGEFYYDPSSVKQAHERCLVWAYQALKEGKNVVVSNTFMKMWELQRYVDLGFPYRVVEMKERWPNIHGVPESKIAVMASNWEALPIIPLTPQKRPRWPLIGGDGPKNYARVFCSP